MTEDLPLEEKVIVYPIPSLRQNDYKNNPSRYIHILSRTPRLSTQNPQYKDRPSAPNPNTPNPNPPEAHTHAGTRKHSAAARKAAATRKHRAAGRKAAATRKRRAAGRKAAATRAQKKQPAAVPQPAAPET